MAAELLQLLELVKSFDDQASAQSAMSQHAQFINRHEETLTEYAGYLRQHAGILDQHTANLTQLNATIQQQDQALRVLAASEDATAWLVHVELAILIGLLCGITVFAILWGRSIHRRIARIESRIPTAPST